MMCCEIRRPWKIMKPVLAFRIPAICIIFLLLFAPACREAEQPENLLQAYVVLLPGLGRTSRSMALVEARFLEEGYRVRRVDYPSRQKTVAELAEVLDEAVAPLCEEAKATVHFVTHSLGGVVLRYYLAHHECPALGRAVMLSPPNQGTEIVDRLGDNKIFRLATGPSAQQLGTGPDSIPRELGPVEFELGVITGDQSLNPVGSIMIPGEDDGTVAVESAMVEGMRDFLVVPSTHSFIMRHPGVIDQALYFIRNGVFRREKQ
jgi:hypothetical protein